VCGAYDLPGDAAVSGISYYEAQAYVQWLKQTRPDSFADVRLPHEYEWEIARRLQLLEDCGQAWEWCSNTFHPYPGFQAFPYDRYSKAWFDGNHFTLRGGSLQTRPAIKRPAFRNFYNADKRHIFAGLRLAYGDQSFNMPPSTMSV
jgi:iron(II)-dependent oxidoreductase